MNLKKHLPPIILLFAMIMAQQIFVNSDTTILGMIKGDYEVGLYSTTVKIYNIVATIINSIVWVVMPQLSRAFCVKDYGKVNSFLKYTVGFTATLGLPCALGMGVLSPQIIEIIAGKSYLGAVHSLQILSVSLVFSLAWGIVMNMLLLPSSKDKPCLLACVVSALLNIILNILLIPYFGLNAAATTTAISQITGLLICIPFVDKQVRLKQSTNMILKPFIGTSLMFFYLLLCINIFDNIWIVTIISIGGSVIIYFASQILLRNKWILDTVRKIIKK